VSVKLQEVPCRVQLLKVVAQHGNVDWVITNEVATQGSLTVDVVRARSDVRWQIEQFHREGKN